MFFEGSVISITMFLLELRKSALTNVRMVSMNSYILAVDAVMLESAGLPDPTLQRSMLGPTANYGEQTVYLGRCMHAEITNMTVSVRLTI